MVWNAQNQSNEDRRDGVAILRLGSTSTKMWILDLQMTPKMLILP